MANRKLGETQRRVLKSISYHGGWDAAGRCGWLWDTNSGTLRIVESLVRRGLVTLEQQTGKRRYTCYVLTDAGLEVVSSGKETGSWD